MRYFFWSATFESDTKSGFFNGISKRIDGIFDFEDAVKTFLTTLQCKRSQVCLLSFQEISHDQFIRFRDGFSRDKPDPQTSEDV